MKKGYSFTTTLQKERYESLLMMCELTQRTKSNYIGILVEIAHLEHRSDSELLEHLHFLRKLQSNPQENTPQ